MLEIEIKAFIQNHDEIEKKLIDSGALFRELISEEDVYFHHPCRNFIQTGEAFRIRKMNERCCITYKGPKLSARAKTRFEEETGIEDSEKAFSIFEKLGFIKGGTVRKTRKVYSFRDAEICLDDVEGLGCFVEIEKIGMDHSVIEKDLFLIAGELGLTEFTTESYLSMLTGNANEKN